MFLKRQHVFHKDPRESKNRLRKIYFLRNSRYSFKETLAKYVSDAYLWC